jgi:hypothetical protein
MDIASSNKGKRNDILGSRRLEHVVVLGANGAMGFGSGAGFTTAVPKVNGVSRDDGGFGLRGLATPAALESIRGQK